MDTLQNLQRSASYYGSIYGCNEKDIKVEECGREYSVEFGDIRTIGFELFIWLWYDNAINRIIVSAGKTPSGKSVYIETREQEVLDNFLLGDGTFTEWMEKTLNDLEYKFERMLKREREVNK